MDRIFILIGSVAAFLGVAMGAFGAHALKEKLSEPMIVVYNTAVQYHLVHAIGLLAVGCVARWRPESPLVNAAGWALLSGIVLFSGSLYGLAISEVSALGMITPMGGVAFLLGWLLLALGVLRSR